jgi:hypothetical protein
MLHLSDIAGYRWPASAKSSEFAEKVVSINPSLLDGESKICDKVLKACAARILR